MVPQRVLRRWAPGASRVGVPAPGWCPPGWPTSRGRPHDASLRSCRARRRQPFYLRIVIAPVGVRHPACEPHAAEIAAKRAILRATHNGFPAQMTAVVVTALGAGPAAHSGRPAAQRARIAPTDRWLTRASGRADPVGAPEPMKALIAWSARGVARITAAADLDGWSAAGRST
jgi:hypothetical protein